MKHKALVNKWLRTIIGISVVAIFSACMEVDSETQTRESDTALIAASVRVKDSDADVMIGNRFSGMTFWHYHGTTYEQRAWHEDAEKMPANWVKDNYPWLEEIRLLTAIGGSFLHHRGTVFDVERCEFDRDLYENPGDRTVKDDFDFSPLIRACRNILRQGLKPIVKLHNVPIKLVSEPHIGWFRVNVRPPDCYDEYEHYVEMCIKALIDEFGLEEVRSWRWKAHTEMNNANMLQTADEDPENSKRAFFKLYDHTFRALQNQLGREYVNLTSHGYDDGHWDHRDFLDYVFKDESLTGIDNGDIGFYAVSYYDIDRNRIPGDLDGFGETIKATRERLRLLGHPELPLEIGEGGNVFGRDGHWLWHGLCYGGEFDLTWTALSFKKMIEYDVINWARWPNLRTYGVFSGVETLSTHLLRLIYEMKDSRVMNLEIESNGNLDDQTFDGVAGFDADARKLYILFFNHKGDWREPGRAVSVELEIENIFESEDVVARMWRLDRDHGDFWRQWEIDRDNLGITRSNYGHNRSMDQIYVQNALTDPAHIRMWFEREEEYARLARMPEPRAFPVEVSTEKITSTFELDQYSVVFMEYALRD